MAALKDIGTIDSDQEIEDYESDGSVQEEEKVQYCFLTFDVFFFNFIDNIKISAVPNVAY